MGFDTEIVNAVAETLVKASSAFHEDQKKAYQRAINREVNDTAKWALEIILENAEIAEKNSSPLCDDTGTPHIIIDVGTGRAVTGDLLDSINEGVRQGLRRLPGRPMAVLGDGAVRLAQAIGMDEDPGALDPAPVLVRRVNENEVLRVHVLMLGGGPALRGKTLRVFHRHDAQNIIDELVKWSIEGTNLLGCTPCVMAIGIGRSQYEATNLMLQAMADGSFDIQSEMEQEITARVNASGAGAISLGGNNTVLATFMKIGPQRASGWRVCCLRSCCCFEPRKASIDL